MDEIENSFIINNKNDDLIAFVFLRDTPYEFNGNIKDGIHLIFPYIVSEPHIQYIIRNNVIKRCIEEKILDDIPTKNQMNDIIDRSIIEKNGWFMYGSSKPYCEAYKLTTIYDCNLDSIPMDEIDYRGMPDLPSFFSIRRFTMDDMTQIRQEKFSEIDKITKRQTSLTLKHLKQFQNTQYDVQQISNLLNILSPARCSDYQQWMEIGWCLYNINQNDIELLNLWIEFSKKDQKFKDGECEKAWGKMRGFNNNGKKLGIGSLYYWAKNDNPDEYMVIKRKDIRYYIDKSMNCTNYDIARVMFEMFKYQHVCASIKYGTWYEFRDHRWHEDDGAISLRQKISTNLVNEYFRIISDYNIEWAKIDMDSDLTSEEKDKRKQEFEEKTKTLSNIMIKLKTTAFKDNIMKECKELFHERGFINKLDENPYLIGFVNGVYDLQKMEFRDGDPEDYISMSTKNYYIEYDEGNPQVDEINDFLNKILPTFNLKQYIMKLLASTLQGHNAEEKFRIWVGVGGNGKTKILELHATALGEYADSFDVMLFTGKRAQSNAATPEVALSKGKRFMQIDEPEEGAKINVGLMKYYTGGDKIKARGLFKDPVEFKPQFKMVLVCNELPEVPAYDGGVWRRLEVSEFPNKFVDNPTKDNEFQKDPELSNKLKMWGETFMSMLIYYYKIYKSEGVAPPKEVTKFTDEFQKESDSYTDFVDTRLIKMDDNNYTCTMAEVCREFKMWHTESNVSTKMLSKPKLVKYLIKRFGKVIVSNEYIKGYSTKTKLSEIRSNAVVSMDNDQQEESDTDTDSTGSIVEMEFSANGDVLEF
jgi:P4 family phage/plasmid primase-like protien